MPGDKYTRAGKVGVDVPEHIILITSQDDEDDEDARSSGRIARSALPCVVHPWERTIYMP